MARVEARAILNDLAQVVRHEAHHIMQLVLFVRSLHHLLEVFADFGGSAGLLCLFTIAVARLGSGSLFALTSSCLRVWLVAAADDLKVRCRVDLLRITLALGTERRVRRATCLRCRVQKLVGEAIQDRVVLSSGVLSDGLEAEDALTLGIDAHPFEALALVRGHVRVEVPALHLQNCRSLVAKGIQGFDQRLRHELLLSVEVFTDVLELVD